MVQLRTSGAQRIILIWLSGSDWRIPAGMILPIKQVLILLLLSSFFQSHGLWFGNDRSTAESYSKWRLDSVSWHTDDVLSSRQGTIGLVYARWLRSRLLMLHPIVKLMTTIKILLVSFVLVVLVIFVETQAYFLFGLDGFALSSSVIVLWPIERRFDGITGLLVDHLLIVWLLILPVLLVLSLCYYLLGSLLIPAIWILTCRWSITSARLEPHLLLLYLIHLTSIIFRIVSFHIDAVVSLTAIS